MAFEEPTATIPRRIEGPSPEEQVAERTEERDDEDVEQEADLDDVEPTEEDLEDAATATPDPAGPDVESIHEVLEKQEARDEQDEVEEAEPVAPVAASPDERIEPLEARVVPIQSSEFVCKNCFLVKHRSQLADKRRMFCRDCA
jgi:hypothetical protein